MERPCCGFECARYVERCGGDPTSSSDYICMGCGADGPMNWFFNQCLEDDDSAEDDAE